MDNSEKARERYSLSIKNQDMQEEPEVLRMGYWDAEGLEWMNLSWGSDEQTW